MVWQRNDDQYGVSRKVTRIPRGDRLAAVGLDQLAKNYSVRALTDGVLDEVELVEVLATRKLIDTLVEVGLWHRDGHDCDRCVQPPHRGVVIHDFLEYNPSRQQVETLRESERVRKASQRDKRRNPGGSDHPVPVPVPRRDKAHPRQASNEGDGVDSADDPTVAAAQSLGIKNLGRVRASLGDLLDSDATDGEVVDVAAAVLGRSRTFVNSPEAYIEKAVKKSRHEVSVYAYEAQAKSPRRLKVGAL